jgi:GH15 family glucan-1,4-alpha-glucosidase
VPVPHSDAAIGAEFDATVAFWRGWLRRSRYSGRWREMVHRSALTLKLLRYAPTGAIVAAPATSLPEEVGGARNWDYRYTWMRDSAFTLYALLRLGFVQHYDTDVLDASLLFMPLCKFIAPADPRWLSTLDAITAELVSDSLVHRYNVEESPDGLAGGEATFSMCSFWWVEALARAGRLDEARLAFEKMLTYANHVGLYSEEIGLTGEQLGKFPQAFTHLALISAAYNLDRQLG